LIIDILFGDNFDSVLLTCLEKVDLEKVLKELYYGLARGHFEEEITTHKILSVGYYWITMFKVSYAYAPKCQTCQKSIGREKKHDFPCN